MTKGIKSESLNVVESYANGVSRNRLATGVTTRESITWGIPVNEVTITAVGEAAGTAAFPGSMAVCFDAPSDLVADTWLTASADLKTVDTNMSVIMIGQTRTFYFSGDGITRLDVKKLYGGEATMALFVEAA